MSRAIDRIDAWESGSRVEDDQLHVARLMLRAAFERRESRGAHYRLDCPEPAQGRPARSFVEPRPYAAETLTVASSRVA